VALVQRRGHFGSLTFVPTIVAPPLPRRYWQWIAGEPVGRQLSGGNILPKDLPIPDDYCSR
jgi:hypothetical protein